MRYLYIPLTLMLVLGTAGADDVRRVVVHLDEAGPVRQNLVLNNASNVNRYCQDKGQEVEIVTYGPALTIPVSDGRLWPALARVFLYVGSRVL